MMSKKETVRKKSILMIYDHLEIGGIETLIIRISTWLLDQGYVVKLILRNEGKLFPQLDKRVLTKVYRKKYELLFTPLTAQLLFCNKFYTDIDVVYTFRPEGLYIASILARLRKEPLKVFNCVYHPREYFLRGMNNYQTKFYSKILLSNYPKGNLAFMNLPCKVSHEHFFNRKFAEAIIFPLPITSVTSQTLNRCPKKYKIVSIGNFKAFKTYNIYMIDIVQRLIAEGFEIRYEIFGDGEIKPVVEDKIREYKLENYVSLHGQIKYEKLKSVLKDAYLFVGMGTSVVEAALCKVPSIVAVENSILPISYGYLYDMPGFSVGERVEGQKEFSVEELIRNVLLLEEDDYEYESNKNYEFALKYDMNEIMKSFMLRLESEYFQVYSFKDIKSNVYYRFYLQRALSKLKHLSSLIIQKFNSLY